MPYRDRAQRRRDEDRERDKPKGRNFVAASLFALIIIPVTHWVSPGHIPFSTADIWSFHGTGLGDWFTVGWPVLVWAVGVNLAVQFYNRTQPESALEFIERITRRSSKPTRTQVLTTGFILSLWAGVAEEISFRWLIYLSTFTSAAITNWLFFGWAGFGIPEWFHLNIWGPIANWTTLDELRPWIFDQRTWLVGGAMLATNAFFRDGHKYLGPFGWLNAWFIGMFMFYVMFNYGLLACIVLHFTYDMLIFATSACFVGKS